MKNILQILPLLSLLLLTSCDMALIKDNTTPTSIFEDLWSQMDKRYPYFDIKDVDWDSVHTKYAARINDNMSSQQLFKVLSEMIGELKDGHVNLFSSFDKSHSDKLYETIMGEPNYLESALYAKYLGYDYHTTGSIYHNGLKDNHIGYLYYPSWNGTISKDNLNYLYTIYAEADGLIFDLRANTGGYVENLRTFLKSLPSNGQLLYTDRVKNGPGREDFGDPIPSYAPENEQDLLVWSKPMIVLIGPQSYSCSTVCAMCMKAYDNVTLVGSTTGGGTSVVYTFGLSNGWEYRTPMGKSYAIDGKCYENGLPPDKAVQFDPVPALLFGTDNVIEYACNLILNSK